ncbi:MAG: hypothetical protein canaca05_05620 [Anaerolineaceae bacterium]
MQANYLTKAFDLQGSKRLTNLLRQSVIINVWNEGDLRSSSSLGLETGDIKIKEQSFLPWQKIASPLRGSE